MATMNVSLPDKMKVWVESRSEDGCYANVSDYVRDLIRRDQIRAEKRAALARQLQTGEAGGYSDMSIDEVFKAALTNADE